MIDWGLTIPKDHIADFLLGNKLAPGKSRGVTLIWDKKKYPAKLSHFNLKKTDSVYQLRWDNSKDFLLKLRTTFIQSYVILKSQKELFEKGKTGNEHFRTNLEGGQQEVIIFQPLTNNEIKVKVYIRIKDEWNALFERLVKENVFGWIFEKKEKEYLIQKSTDWYPVSEFENHKNAINVIYYLENSRKKLLYIGKADNFGKRVKPGRIHQNMPGDWDRFKYDIIRLEFSNILERIEDHTIRTVASILKNNNNYSSLNIGQYKLVNAHWKKL